MIGDSVKRGKRYFKSVVIVYYYCENTDLDRKKCYLACSIS